MCTHNSSDLFCVASVSLHTRTSYQLKHYKHLHCNKTSVWLKKKKKKVLPSPPTLVSIAYPAQTSLGRPRTGHWT